MVYSSVDLLLDCVELCKSTRYAADVFRQCQIDDYGFVVKVRFQLLPHVCVLALYIYECVI